MLKLPLDGYRATELLRSSSGTQVFAAVREHDERPVVVKLYELSHSTGVEARVEHEFTLIHELDIEGVVRSLALERAGTRVAVVLDWCAGVNLAQLCEGQPLELELFFDIAQQLARILAQVHASRVIHRDIKPTNIIVDPQTRKVWLADFGISVLLASERERLYDARVIEGTLPYVSPEQTGRTGRDVDFRSDLYSLGVTFYELLTGQRPFTASAPLELIHAHLARRPESPQRLRAEVPSALDAIVMRLLEKAPERRYQSARGLRLDLERLREQLDGGGGVPDFELGTEDVSMILQLPHRLYGRSVEVELLIREYHRAGEGESRFALISGPAGMGKSALMQEVAEPVLALRGFLARGRFLPEQRSKPFSGILIALNDLTEQLLTQSDDRLGHWRMAIASTLGPLSSVVCELLPRLRAVLGPAASPSEEQELDSRGPVESHSRSALALARFVSVFARSEHPLALALDDLHWADRASCELLASLLTEPGLGLLLLGTMRMDEAFPGHPVHELIDACDSELDKMLWLDLGPLGRREIAALVGDALGRDPGEVTELAALIGRKSNQNPYFIRQFMTHLVELELLRATASGWEWDADEIEQAGVPDDLVEMMSAKLDRLEDRPRGVLMTAAVIGPRFELQLLEELQPSNKLGRALVRLVEEGLLTPMGPHSYAFGHERIRALAYAAVPAEQRAVLHRQIATFALERFDFSEVGDNVFELVDHIDHGYGLIPMIDESRVAADARAQELLPALDRFERDHFAELNALAGHRALNGAAAEGAVNYLEAGVRLLELGEDWPEPSAPGHGLRLGLELGLCQALALAGRSDEAERRFAVLLHREVEVTDYGRIVAKRIESHVLANERHAALEAGIEGLRELGFVIEEDGPSAVARLLSRLDIDEMRALLDAPRASEPAAQAGMEVLTMVTTSARRVDRSLFAALVVMHAELVMSAGLHSSAAMAFAQLALLLGTDLGQHGRALALLDLARTLSEREGTRAMGHRLAPVEALLRGWRSSFAEALERLRNANVIAMEAGDVEFARLSTLIGVSLTYAAGTHLRGVERNTELSIHRLRQWGAIKNLATPMAYLDFTRLLLSGDVDLMQLADPLGLEELEEDLEVRSARLGARLLQVRLFLMFGRVSEAWELIQECRAEISMRGIPAWHFVSMLECEGVAAACLIPEAEGDDANWLLGVLERAAILLREHVRAGAIALVATATLLEAELAMLHGKVFEGFARFSQARREAAELGVLVTEALVLERMAIHAHALGLPELTLGPLREARERYHYWGAFTKVAALERDWEQLREGELGSGGGRTSFAGRSGERSAEEQDEGTSTHSSVHAGSASTSIRSLDTSTVFEATRAIAAEIRLEEVVGRLMTLALESAGADRAVLLLRLEGQMGIVGEYSAERPLRTNLRQPRAMAEAGSSLPLSLLHFVLRTREPALFADIRKDLRFASDPYIDHQRPRSVLCLPIIKQSNEVGLLYLENKLSPGSFTAERVDLLEVLVAQAASALENAQLYERLRTSELRWRSLVEGLPDVIMLVDIEGRVEFVNHGRDDGRRHIVGRLAGEFVHELDIAELRANMREVISTHTLRGLELRGRFVTEDWRRYSARLAPIVVDGRVERVIAVGTDVTDLREAEAERARLEVTVRQQQRLESIGTLASGVAHEINNPVQGIMNYAELISASQDATPMIRDFSEEIHHESERVATIVRNLLAFSRQEGDRAAAATQLNGVVRGALSLIRTVLRKDKIELQVEIPEDLPRVDCRVQQIQQVLMNLVTNARDALRERWAEGPNPNKRIEITGSHFESEGRGWVRLSVRDYGGGVAEDVVARIFDPFFTTKGRDQGTGLGLSVSHGIVAEHGGELWLENRLEEGATFHVDLPANTERD